MKKILTALTAALLALGCALPALAAPSSPAAQLTILFTHDTHDHVRPAPEEGGGEYGGYVRLATLLNEQRESAQCPVVTLDAGDFSMGTLYQTVYKTQASELRLLGAMGYDVTTLGNHEFDYRAQGLSQMLESAVASGERLPYIVQANYKPPAEDETTWAAWEDYGISDYVILERDGLRVAVFGLLGQDAHESAPMSGMVFEPIVDAAKRTVSYIEEHEDTDFIICLSHSGTRDGKGEDWELAKKVDGIDVIISGHTHTTLTQPIRVGDTLIVSAGEYTQNLGVLTVSKQTDADGNVVGGLLEDYEYSLLPVDESVAEDSSVTQLANRFQAAVEQEYLSQFGYTFGQVLAQLSFDFTPVSQFAAAQEDDSLGSLIADSYRYAVEQAEGGDYVPVDFAVVAAGVIRGSFAAGEITVADAFAVSSLGSGADGTAGYPLVSVYLTGRELKDVFEVDASISGSMPSAQLYGSGMTWSYNTNRIFLNKVTQCAQVLPDGTTAPLEDDRLYRVVTGLYSAQMLGTVEDKSFGLLSITPRDANGEPIEDVEEYIIRTSSGSELKEWYALASYLEHLEQVPEQYAAPLGDKQVYASWNPIDLLKSPNWLTLLILLAVVVVIAVVALVVYRLHRRRRRYGTSRVTGGYRSRSYRGRRRRW